LSAESEEEELLGFFSFAIHPYFGGALFTLVSWAANSGRATLSFRHSEKFVPPGN
jgi:hypothetical protein